MSTISYTIKDNCNKVPKGMIRSIKDLFTVVEGFDKSDMKKSISSIVYSETDCGAWITYDNKGINIGSIVEGSDAEFSTRFDYPFLAKSLANYIDDLEIMVEEANEP